jgi:hypothetical protein
MSETSNIAKMAELISKDIFTVFKWVRRKTQDTNWSCENKEIHATKSGTHPSDVIFMYKDAYLGVDVYVNVDLKSYSKASIRSSSLKSAIVSLSKATNCANYSSSFHQKYIYDDTSNFNVVGMLFVYNHCGTYDSDFNKVFDSISYDDLFLSEDDKLFILSPQKIQKLNNIACDIKMLIADEILPSYSNYSFLYPDNKLTKNKLSHDEPATLEVLLSDTIIIKYEYDEGKNIKPGFLVYFSKENPSIDDFIYLLDSFSHYQMLDRDRSITVKYTYKEESGMDLANKFDAAISRYCNICGKNYNLLSKNINFEVISNFKTHFSDSVIGMDGND